MYRVETIVERGSEADRVTSAFNRFLELARPASNVPAWVETEILGDRERKIAVLWSHEAAMTFRRYLYVGRHYGAI